MSSDFHLHLHYNERGPMSLEAQILELIAAHRGSTASEAEQIRNAFAPVVEVVKSLKATVVSLNETVKSLQEQLAAGGETVNLDTIAAALGDASRDVDSLSDLIKLPEDQPTVDPAPAPVE